MSNSENAVPADPQGHPADLESLVKRVVESTLAQIGEFGAPNPFISSRECASLIGVTPEHLCAMRSRGDGPPWSGRGKWIRYKRRAALDWLGNLAGESSSSPTTSDADKTGRR